MRYYFVGGLASIPKHSLERFGQVVDLTHDEWVCYVKARVALLPESEFDRLGVTEQELSLHSRPAATARAPEAFLAKRRAAQVRFRELYNLIKGGADYDYGSGYNHPNSLSDVPVSNAVPASAEYPKIKRSKYRSGEDEE